MVESSRIQRHAAAPQLARGLQQGRALRIRRVGQAGHRDNALARRAELLARQRGQRMARPHFQQHARGCVEHLRQRSGETHRDAQMSRPVFDRTGLAGVEPVAQRGRHQRQLRTAQFDGGKRRAERFQHRLHHRRMEGVRGLQQARGDAVGLQRRAEILDRVARTGHHAGARRVLRRQRQIFRQARLQRIQRQSHRQHRARRLRLHQFATPRDQRDRVAQAEHTGQRGRHELAHAVADHRRRPEAQAHPPLRQRVLDGERRRLHHCRGQQRRRVIGEYARGQIETALLAQGLGAGIKRVAEHRLARMQRAAHARVLRALAGEQEHHVARLRQRAARRCRGGFRAGQLRAGADGGVGDHGQSMRKRLAPDRQRPRRVGKLEVGRRGQVDAQPCGCRAQRGSRARRQQKQLRPGGRLARCRRRRFFQHHVCIGAAHAERAHARAARYARFAGPLVQAVVDHERRAGEVDRRVGRGVMQARRNAPLGQRQRGLDHAGCTGGDHQVADVALDRAETAEAGIRRVAAKRLDQAFDLDRIADRRGRAVGFHVGDAACVDAGVALGHRDHRGLALAAGRHEAGLGAAVVVDRATTDHRDDRVAIGLRVGQPLQQHHRRAIAEHRAACLGVEAARVAVRRQHGAILEQIAAARRAGDRGATGQRHLALAVAQALHCLADRHQRGGTGGVHAHRRAGEIELVRHPRRDEILLVVQHDLERPELFDLVGMRADVMLEIGCVVHAGEHADRTVLRAGRMAGAFQALPAQLQEQPLLRIHQLRLARADAEERGVEQLHTVDHAACGDVGRVVAQAGRNRRVELARRETGDRLAPFAQVLPEALDVRGAGETAAHADDRDRFGAGVRAGGTGAGQPRRFDAIGAGVIAVTGQRQRRGVAEEGQHVQRGIAVATQAIDQPHRQQRAAAQLEEIVAAAHLVQREAGGKRRAQACLRLAHRSLVGHGQLRPRAARCRQRGAVELAVGGDRQRVQHHPGGRQHELRQFGGQAAAQRRQVGTGGGGHHIGHQALAQQRVVAQHDGASAHAGLAQQRRLDLAGLDAVAADLDLAVAAPDELQRAIMAPAHQVAGAIQAIAGIAEWVGHETLGSQLLAPEIAARHAGAADVQLADHAHRQQLTGGAQHVHASVGDRPTDRHRARVGRQVARDRPGAGEGGALGRAVAVDDLHAGQGDQCAAHVIDRQRLAADQQLAQAVEPTRLLVDHRIEQRRGQPRRADAFAGDGRGQAGGGGDRFGMDHHAAAVQQRAPDFQGRRIETERRGVQHARVGIQPHVVDAAHQSDDRTMGDRHAFGRAGGAGGVHHVGKRIAVDRRQRRVVRRGCGFDGIQRHARHALGQRR